MSHKGETVLITGISGYLGSAVAVKCLQDGYTVRGVVRDEPKAKRWEAAYQQYKEHLQWAYVTDIVAPRAYDQAAQGVDYIIHLAAPLADKLKDAEQDLLSPAINSTLGIMAAAAQEGSKVKRVVITSSLAALENYPEICNPGHVWTEADWNQIPYEQAKKETKDMAFIYCCAKRCAEQAAFDYVKKHSPRYDLVSSVTLAIPRTSADVSIVPVTTFGPTSQPVKSVADLPLSCTRISDYFDCKELPRPPISPPVADVEDMALCHVRALQRPECSGQRYLCGVNGHTPEIIAHILREAFPDQAHRIPDVEEKSWDPEYRWDGSKATRDLGIEWKTLAHSVIGAARQYLELERQQKAA